MLVAQNINQRCVRSSQQKEQVSDDVTLWLRFKQGNDLAFTASRLALWWRSLCLASDPENRAVKTAERIRMPNRVITRFFCLVCFGWMLCVFNVCAGKPEIPAAADTIRANIAITIIDSVTGLPTPVRVRIAHSRGSVIKVPPPQAIGVMYGVWDHADGYAFQPDSAFYVDGRFTLSLPPGEYTLTLSKGLEYLEQQHVLKITAQTVFRKTYTMTRWIDMPQRGWYSGDGHIHIRRSPQEDSLLIKWIQAEDVHVGVLLRMGDFWATYYEQYGWGEAGVYQVNDYLLAAGQEDPRTPELGHVIGIGATDKVRYKNEYYYYDKVFDEIHRRDGVTGYAHQAESFHGYRGLILDGLRGKIDMLELLQFCVDADPLQTRHYYHLLDLGYPVTAIAGSDFPWCGKDHDKGSPERSARIGNVRFYTFIDKGLTYGKWKAALRAGQTFVSSGPMLELKINGHLPGDFLNVKKGGKLVITARAYGHSKQVPLQRLEIISHGQVIGVATADELGQSSSDLVLEMEIPVMHGLWIAARCYARKGQAAHTTPHYVSVEGQGFHNTAALARYLKLSEDYLDELANQLKRVTNNPEQQAWRYRKGLEQRITETRQVIDQLRKKIP